MDVSKSKRLGHTPTTWGKHRWSAWLCALAFVSHGAETLPTAEEDGQNYTLGWSGYTRGFRRNHNLGWGVGYNTSIWRLSGPYQNDHYSVRAHSEGVKLTCHYAYHIPIAYHFGYLLGSSAGIERSWFPKSSPLRVDAIYHIPGLWLGGVYDYALTGRMILGIDAYFQYVDNLQLIQNIPKLTMTINMMTLVDSMLIWDVFYSLQNAIRIEYHVVWTDYERPLKSAGGVLGGNVQRYETHMGVGLVYHLL